MKAATQLFMGLIGALPISIHAAREGGDPSGRPVMPERVHFNPRRP